MSNIYVGGISFESGFTSGFQITPLQISNVEIASTTSIVVTTSGISLSVPAAAIDILPLELLDVTITKNVNVNASPSVVEILSNTTTTSTNNNTLINVDTSTVELIANLSSAFANSNIFVDVDNSDISISVKPVGIITDGSQSISVNPTYIDISANIITLVSSSTPIISVNRSIVEILTNNVSVVSTVNVITETSSSNIEISTKVPSVYYDASVLIDTQTPIVEILINDLTGVNTGNGIQQTVNSSTIDVYQLPASVTLSIGIDIQTDSSIVNILSNDSVVVNDINILVAKSDVIITTLTNTLDVGSSVFLATQQSLVNITTNTVTPSAGFESVVYQSIVNILPNIIDINASAQATTNESKIIIKPLDIETVSTGVDVYPIETVVLIKINNAVGSVGAFGYAQSAILSAAALSPSVNFGVGVIATPSLIKIRPRVIDGAGPKIPNWTDSDTSIDNQFWDSSSTCKDSESKLFNGLINNAFDMYGVDAVWYPVDYSLNNEKIYGEDNSRTVIRNFRIKYYLEDLNSAASDNQQFNKWGIEGLDNFEIYISKSAYEQASQLNMNGNIVSRPYLPKPGDIMRSEHLSVYYEVVDVKDRTELFLQRSHSWTMTLRPVTNKHYNYDPSLNGDDIITALQTTDVLGQNNYIDTQTSAVMYNDQINPNDDPFNLFD